MLGPRPGLGPDGYAPLSISSCIPGGDLGGARRILGGGENESFLSLNPLSRPALSIDGSSGGYLLIGPCIGGPSICLKSSGGGGATLRRPLKASEISGAENIVVVFGKIY